MIRSIKNSTTFKTPSSLLLVEGIILLALATWTTPYMTVAALAYFLLVTGLLKRKENKKTHAILMSLGILTDLLLVLVLEIQRGAIDTTFSFTLSPLQQAHIFSSSLAVLFYFPTVYLGIRRYRGTLTTPASKRLHIRLGLTAFIFRTLGFILMFSLISHVR